MHMHHMGAMLQTCLVRHDRQCDVQTSALDRLTELVLPASQKELDLQVRQLEWPSQ